MDAVIVEQISRLLHAYGNDAVTCLQELSNHLKTRVEVEGNTTPIQGLEANAWNLENVIVQTIHMEGTDIQDGATNTEKSNDSRIALLRCGIKVLRYYSCLESPSGAGETSFQVEVGDRIQVVETLCSTMSRYPQDSIIQESACAALSQQPTLTRFESDDLSAKASMILFPVLQAMNWHKRNLSIANSGMLLLKRILSNKSLTNQQRAAFQTQVMEIIDLTGGLSIFFLALKPLSQSSFAAPSPPDLKANVCDALGSLTQNHPGNQEIIAKHQGISAVFDTMRLFPFLVDLQASILRLLASLAYGPESKKVLLAKGGLDCILTCMKENYEKASIQATGCRAIANVFAGTTDDLKAKGALCVKPILRAMRMYPCKAPSTSPSKEAEANQENPVVVAIEQREDDFPSQIQLYGCAALRNLSRLHQRLVVEAGGITTILVAVIAHMERPAIQEQAWAALFHLMMNGSLDDTNLVVSEGGLQLLLQILTKHSRFGRVQQHGISCLACLSTKNPDTIEKIFSDRGLDLVLKALYMHGQRNPEVSVHACYVLRNLTITTDFQRAVAAKNGVNLVVIALQKHPKVAQVQLSACASLRNLSKNKENLVQIGEASGIAVLLSAITNHADHASLMAYAMDTLARVTVLKRIQVELLSQKGLVVVVEAMKAHPDSTPILEQGCLIFSNMSKLSDAMLWMKQNDDFVGFLKSTPEKKLPRNSQVRPVVKNLIRRLRRARIFMSRS